MYIKGIVIAIDPNSPRIKLKVPDFDNFETGWFFIPQLCTVKDKSHNKFAINTLVGACCTDDMQDGCVIGAMYNDEDVCVLSNDDIKYIFFEDGTKLKYDKSEHKLTADCIGDIDIKAVNVNLQAETTNITSNVNITGNLAVSGEVSDRVGTMSLIRTIYNSHQNPNGGAIRESDVM